jgi:hypothetical protein
VPKHQTKTATAYLHHTNDHLHLANSPPPSPNIVALLEIIDNPELKKIYLVLEHVARLGYGATTKLLVDRGSVVTTKDNDARTARDLAEGSDRAIKALNGEEPDFYMYKDRMILL